MRALWWLVTVGACAQAGSDPAPTLNQNPDQESIVATDCTVRIAPGDPVQPHLKAGAVVCLSPGVHRGGLRIEQSVDLVGEPGAVLDGGGRGPVVHVVGNGIDVRLKSLTLQNGDAEFGSGLRVDGYATVALDGCALRDNAVGQGHGAGIGMARGRLVARALQAGPTDDLFFDNVAEAVIENSVVQGSFTVRDGAKVAVRGGRIGGPLTMAGTTTRRPALVLEDVLAPDVDNHATLPGALTIR